MAFNVRIAGATYAAFFKSLRFDQLQFTSVDTAICSTNLCHVTCAERRRWVPRLGRCFLPMQCKRYSVIGGSSAAEVNEEKKLG